MKNKLRVIHDQLKRGLADAIGDAGLDDTFEMLTELADAFDQGLVLDLLELPNIKKSELADHRTKYKWLVDEGYIDPLKLYAGITQLDKLFFADKIGVKTLLKNDAFTAYEQYAKGEDVNVGFMYAERGVTMQKDYSNDPTWEELNQIATKAKAALKARQTILDKTPAPDATKGIEAVMEAVEIGTRAGEVVPLLPPIKSSSDYVKFTLRN